MDVTYGPVNFAREGGSGDFGEITWLSEGGPVRSEVANKE